MAPHEPPTITSTRNRRIVEARKLRLRKHRADRGRFLVEGLQLLHMALDAGWEPLEAFYTEALFAGPEAPALLGRMRETRAEIVPVAEAVMVALAERDMLQGLLATFPLREAAPESVPLTGRELVVVLDRLQDPGNVGTLIRTADAVGAAAIVLIEPGADPFDPKAVRASMGSLFAVPIARAADAPGLLGWLHGRGLRSVGADPRRGRPFGEGVMDGGVALVLGNEARGLSDDVRGAVRAWASLPMVGRAESLNVAEAGAVLMYAWLRENLRSAPCHC